MTGERPDSEVRKPREARQLVHNRRRGHHNPAPTVRGPHNLPSAPASFWAAGVDLDDFEARPEAPSMPVLPRLGPPPFPRGGFPLLGFLATVYEHVAQSAGGAASAPVNAPP
jgi:hypothetical protein